MAVTLVTAWMLRTADEGLAGDVISRRAVAVDELDRSSDVGMFHAGIDSLAAEDLRAMLLKTRANASPSEVEALLCEIARQRPMLAVELARAIGGSEEEISQWTCAVIHTWASLRSVEAWTWFSQQTQHSDIAGNTFILSAILDSMAGQDPDHLLTIVDKRLRQGPGGLGPQIIAHAGMNALIQSGHLVLARNNIEDWVRRLDPALIGAATFESIALHLARSSPTDAGEWLRTLPASEVRDFAIGTFVSDWACRDPHAAMRWAANLPASEGRADSMQRAYGEWAQRDPAQAAEWLDHELSNFQRGPETDQLIASFIAVSPMAREDGEGAMQWTAFIADAELRSKVISGVLAKWLHSDRTSATTYLQQHENITPRQLENIVLLLRKYERGSASE